MYKKTKHINKKLKNEWRMRKYKYLDSTDRLFSLLVKTGVMSTNLAKRLFFVKKAYVERLMDVLSL